jgi:iron complex outermembrane receptor protein
MRSSTTVSAHVYKSFRPGCSTPGISRWVLAALAALGASGVLAADDPKKAAAPAPDTKGGGKDLMEMDLDSLANVKVTSVSKKAEKATDAPAAIFVISQDDIHRTGAATIAEALRMAPGLEVAKIDSMDYAIGSRGFNGQYANKLLVLIDGRTVYSPIFSGVYWNQLDTVMDDIDRIEVIRGPGATVWGANAVDGVINVITKSAKETQGGLLSVGRGTDTKVDMAARYGARITDSTSGRVYATYVNKDDTVLAQSEPGYGTNGQDTWDMVHGGFRIDSDLDTESTLTVEGDVFGGDSSDITRVPTIVSSLPNPLDLNGYNVLTHENSSVFGANILGKYDRKLSADSDFSVQLYYDRVEQTSRILNGVIQQFDFDGQYSFAIGERNSFVTGVGYRLVDDSFQNANGLYFLPTSASRQIFNAFAQDEIELIKDKLRLTLGSKLEHNDYTGFEVEPSARLAFKPTENQTIWGAISRAVRTPARTDDNFGISLSVPAVIPPGAPPANLPVPLPILANFKGTSHGLNSEQLVAYEVGYRIQPTKKLFFDAAAFYNVYDGLSGSATQPPAFSFDPATGAPYLAVNSVSFNGLNGETYGGELAATYQALENWRIHANYSFIEIQLHQRTLTPVSESDEHATPQNQFSIRNTIDLPFNLQLDGTVRYIDRITAVSAYSPAPITIPSYVTADLRLGWKATKNLEFAVIGRNLVDSRHVEFIPGAAPFTHEMSRSVFGKITYSF